MRGKITKIKVRYLALAAGMILAGVRLSGAETKAAGCPDARFVFARGSGGERWNDKNYLAFKSAIETKLSSVTLDYEFIDLDYPAVGIDNLEVLAGAYLGAGEAYEFGASISKGVKNLVAMVNSASCPGTKYVLGGYSQGAMVVSKALGSLRSDRVVYAATFGDPKLYLPEGKGLIPPACRGEKLSDYRTYVPDCQAYKGLLGAYIPYEPEALVGKVGTWCNKRDIFCSSHLSISDHVAYVADNLYEDASRVIFDKVCRHFELVNTVSSPHDTAILIDSTGSMSGLIGAYKAEALRLAEKTLAAGGRVALYDYRDYQEGYLPRQHCAFETCTLESFRAGLNEIAINGGGDTPESLLASSMQVMQELNWKRGSVKSIVVLTDAGYHEPDFDTGGTTRLDVVALSKRIDPVNFYVITTPENLDSYAALTEETGGRVVTTVDDLSELTEYIMARYDALPRVEEMDVVATLPTLEVDDLLVEGTTATVQFTTDATRVVVALNDAVLGIVEGDTVTIEGLDLTIENNLTLTPLGDDMRGEAVEVSLNGAGGLVITLPTVPKTPNTGRF